MGHPQKPDAESAYEPGKTLGMIAAERTQGLLKQLESGRINEDTPYAKRTYRQVQFDLALGGPGLDVTFVEDSDGEVLSGVVTYYEADGVASYELSLTDAMTLWEALQSPAQQSSEFGVSEEGAR